VNGTLSGAAVTVPINPGSPLAATGGMALVTSNAGDFLVTRTSATTFVALTAQCTHQACVVSDATSTTYVCPCHGSEFDPSTGRVVVGPAVAPLRQFSAQLSGNVLTIA
jgi:Rieske Fe-S protein